MYCAAGGSGCYKTLSQTNKRSDRRAGLDLTKDEIDGSCFSCGARQNTRCTVAVWSHQVTRPSNLWVAAKGHVLCRLQDKKTSSTVMCAVCVLYVSKVLLSSVCFSCAGLFFFQGQAAVLIIATLVPFRYQLKSADQKPGREFVKQNYLKLFKNGKGQDKDLKGIM